MFALKKGPMLDYNMEILVVDDIAFERKIINKTLKEFGFRNVLVAKDGEEAIRKLQIHKSIKLVLCDWNMPGIKGIDVLSFMRSNDNLKEIPLIMITAEATQENIINAVKAGVNDYLIKPFKPLMLKERIEKLFPAE